MSKFFEKLGNTMIWKMTFLGLWWNRLMSNLSVMPETPEYWEELAFEAHREYRSEKRSGYTW